MSQLPVSPIIRRVAPGVAVLCAWGMLWAGPAGRPAALSLTTRDVRGVAVRVPHADRPTVMLFVRIDQEQSAKAVQQAREALKGGAPVQVLAILSGAKPDKRVQAVAATMPWPVVHDRDFQIVGQLRVRVWPTTIVVQPDGRELARLAGLPPSFVSDLKAYLDFGANRIDLKTLQQRLATSGIVTDSAYGKARRHLRVAQRLIGRDDLQLALRELAQGLKQQPNDPAILLTKARVLLLLGQPADALSLLNQLDATSALAPSIGVLKGGAMVATEQWAQAIDVLSRAVRLNPNPSEGYYFLGVAYQHKQQWAKATDAFRKAFETGVDGRLIARSLQKPGPATQPASQPSTAGP